MPAVELAVGLRARALHRRPLGAVQHAELDARLIDNAAHQPIECIDLAYEMTLAEAADGRVARHLADGLEFMRDKRCARTHACGRCGCLAAGVPASNNDDVERNSLRFHRFTICVRASLVSKRAVNRRALAAFRSPLRVFFEHKLYEIGIAFRANQLCNFHLAFWAFDEFFRWVRLDDFQLFASAIRASGVFEAALGGASRTLHRTLRFGLLGFDP